MAGGSKLAVYTAIGANSIVTVAKLAGFAATGSGAMLSEGIHSFADVCNQVLLAVGMKRSETPPDEKYQFGYGNEAFVWALISAVGILFLGCGISVMHGIQSLTHGGHHDASGGNLNIMILIGALIIEGISLLVAVKALMDEAKKHNQTFVTHLKETDDPFGVAILMEDSAAVFGVILALAAVALTHYTHQPYWDAIGSIAIGVLLGAVAFFLMAKNRELLIGRSIRVQDQHKLDALLNDDPAVEAVSVKRTQVTGTQSYQISAEIEFDGRYLAREHLKNQDLAKILNELTSPEAFQNYLEDFGEAIADALGDEVDRIEERIRKELPKAAQIDLEVD